MPLRLSLLLVFSLLWSCKKTAETPQNQQQQTLVFQYEKMPPKLPLNSKVTTLVEKWDAFRALDESTEVLYKARNNEDLILAVNDLIEKEKLLARSSYPELFDTFPVKSRQRVLQTYLYKVKFNLRKNQPTTEPTVEMLEAYNALRRQFNSIVNSQWDKTLLEDKT